MAVVNVEFHRLVGTNWGHPRKSAAGIDFYFVKGRPPDEVESDLQN